MRKVFILSFTILSITAILLLMKGDSNPPSICPVNGEYSAIANFGRKQIPKYPITGTFKPHTGIDFSARTGTEVVAAANGKIIKVENKKSGYGKHIIIKHDNQYQSLYAHHKIVAKCTINGEDYDHKRRCTKV